jgi:DNA repair exonuclease SbcCD ATPase subunit
MQIKDIKISDFRNIEETAAEFAPLTIIRGHNHQGKSSIAQAIQLALTTRTDGTDAQGRSANDKIRVGGKKARIAMCIKGKSGPMPFEVTYGPNKTGRTIVSENPAGFLNWLTNNNERLSCALDSDYFIRQKAEDQKSVLAALVLPQSFAFPEEMRTLAEQRFGQAAINWSAKPLEVIDRAYELAFDIRKTAKAQLAGNHIPLVPATRPKYKADEIRTKLTDLRAEAGKMRVTAPGSEALGRLKEQYSQSGGRLFRAEAEAEETRTAIRDAESNILAPVQLKTYEKVANNRRVFNSLEEQMQVIISQIEEHRTVAQIYRDLLKEKKCPTCRQAITEEFVNARINESDTIVRNQGIKQNEIMRQQRDLGNIEEAEQMVTAHTDAIGQKDTFQRELAALVSTITQEKDSQRDLKAKIEAASGAEQDAKAPNPELDKLNKEIGEWEAALDPAIRYESTVLEIETASARGRELTAKVEALEKLCTYFGKDGVKATLIKQNIEGFSATVNRVLSVWGYSATLSIEPYSFEVTQDSKTLPLKELSGSEKLMFGVALQTAIAYHGKIGMVVIDKADTFINSERKRFFQCLLSLVSQALLEQAIVMLAEDKTETQPRDGVVVYAAQAGKLVKL